MPNFSFKLLATRTFKVVSFMVKMNDFNQKRATLLKRALDVTKMPPLSTIFQVFSPLSTALKNIQNIIRQFGSTYGSFTQQKIKLWMLILAIVSSKFTIPRF